MSSTCAGRRIMLSNNEYKPAEQLGNDCWLYVVYYGATQPEIHAVRNPARLLWAEVLQMARYRVSAGKIVEGSR